MPGSVITRKGQVTIPKAIRDEIQLRIGDRVSFVVRNGEVVLRRPPKSILDLQGSVKPSRQPEDFGRIRQSVKSRRGPKAAQDE